MMRLSVLANLQVFLLALFLVTGCGGPGGNSDEAAAVAAIQKLGGKVEFNDATPAKQVVKVYLNSTGVQDADLVALQKLPQLKNLFLGRTKITDAGLEHIQKASHLETLSLNSTAITDAGLKSLVDLQALKTLNLQETKVTEAGVKDLRGALPKLTIAR